MKENMKTMSKNGEKPLHCGFGDISPEKIHEIAGYMKSHDPRLWRQCFPEEAQGEEDQRDAERRAKVAARGEA